MQFERKVKKLFDYNPCWYHAEAVITYHHAVGCVNAIVGYLAFKGEYIEIITNARLLSHTRTY